MYTYIWFKKVESDRNFKKDHIPVGNKYGRRTGELIESKYLTIHSNGNLNSTAQNERDWLVNDYNKRSASFHRVVDEPGTIEAIPLNERAIHSGNRKGNYESASLEICEGGNRGKTLDNAIREIVHMLFELRLTPSDITTHHRWSGKNCPRILLNDWEWFIGQVEAHYIDELLKREG